MASASPTASISIHNDESQEDSLPLIPMGQTQEELLDTRSRPSVFQVLVLAGGFGTLQLVFALLASYGSAQLLSVGVSQAATGLIWLSGPLAGTFIQPLIGISDKFGHQKIIVATGVIGLVVSLLGLGWAPDLKDEKCELAKALVVLSICTLNIVVQPVQLGLRILIIEACRLEQQTMVSAWVVRMIGIGNILAQLAGSVDTTILRPFTTGGHFKDLCLLTSIGLIITTVGLGLFVRVERTPRSVSEKLNIQQSRSVGLWKAIRTVSPGVLSVWKVQVFSWMGWFQFLYYVTMYIDYLGLHDLLQDSAITDEEAQRSIKTESLQFGSRAMLLNACVSFISSMLLPWLFKGNGLSGLKFSNHITLSNIWMISQALFGAGMICTFWVTSVAGATFIISILGLSWCCTAWIPYTLVSTKLSQESRNALRPHNPGLIMSLHNVSIAAPQILAALIASSIFWASWDGENQARYVLAVGGVFGLGAAWMAKNLTIEKELH
ncbi:Major facilitator superfamily domain general substrate transporter [Penicillium expansum]|nr:Major facilitator superfamily domain general substrate transporter [Penicillium expansum]